MTPGFNGLFYCLLYKKEKAKYTTSVVTQNFTPGWFSRGKCQHQLLISFQDCDWLIAERSGCRGICTFNWIFGLAIVKTAFRHFKVIYSLQNLHFVSQLVAKCRRLVEGIGKNTHRRYDRLIYFNIKFSSLVKDSSYSRRVILSSWTKAEASSGFFLTSN